MPATGELIRALQTIVSRNVPPTDPAVLSITRIEAGSAYNVIPETASIAGTVRAFSDSVRETIRGRIRTISDHIAAAYGLTAEVDIRDIFSVLTNDDASVEIVAGWRAKFSETSAFPPSPAASWAARISPTS